MIHRLVLGNRTFKVEAFYTFKIENRRQWEEPYLGYLLTCRQIHSEASGMLFAINRWEFGHCYRSYTAGADLFTRFCSKLTGSQLNALNDIHLHLNPLSSGFPSSEVLEGLVGVRKLRIVLDLGDMIRKWEDDSTDWKNKLADLAEDTNPDANDDTFREVLRFQRLFLKQANVEFLTGEERDSSPYTSVKRYPLSARIESQLMAQWTEEDEKREKERFDRLGPSTGPTTYYF